jgi:hypothetical protein
MQKKGGDKKMENLKLMYITEEEKMEILNRRLELERKAKRKLSEFTKTKILCCVLMCTAGIIVPLLVGGEGVGIAILLILLGLGALLAQEGDA